MDSIVVYGFSTEGYNLASSLVERGVQVHIIDEMQSSAVLLRPEIAKMYPDVATLNEDEPLMDVMPIRDAVSQAKYLFFAPRIRRTGTDCRVDVNSKLKDAAMHLSEGSSVICNIPSGLGGNAQNMSILKHATGMEAGKDISYYYYPLSGNEHADVIGTISGNKNTELIEILDGGVDLVPIGIAEREHAVHTLSKFGRTISGIEMYKHGAYAPDVFSHTNEMFLDDMVDGLLDLQLIKDSQDNVAHILYMVNGGIRAIEMYIKKLVDVIKHTARKLGLRMSRTDVVVSWHIDRHGIRGDRLEILRTLMTKLQDYTSRVEQYDTLEKFRVSRATLIIACSKSNYEEAKMRQDDMESIIVKATPTVSV